MPQEPCFNCNKGRMLVINTRACRMYGGWALRRNRRCSKCGHNVTTVELPIERCQRLDDDALFVSRRVVRLVKALSQEIRKAKKGGAAHV